MSFEDDVLRRIEKLEARIGRFEKRLDGVKQRERSRDEEIWRDEILDAAAQPARNEKTWRAWAQRRRIPWPFVQEVLVEEGHLTVPARKTVPVPLGNGGEDRHDD